MRNKPLFAAILSISVLVPAPKAQIATGGAYTLEQSVVASGGGASDGGIYKVEGTGGQPAAGTVLANPPYRQIGGFWTPPVLAPTAAGAIVGGAVVNEKGVGIKDAIVSLTGGPLTAPRVAKTNNFGSFAFNGVETGHLYVITVRHARYGFGQSSQILMLFEDRGDIVFRADWEN